MRISDTNTVAERLQYLYAGIQNKVSSAFLQMTT